MPELAEKLANAVNSTLSQPSGSNVDFEEEDLDDEEGEDSRQPRLGANVMSFLSDQLDYQELDTLISQATMPVIGGPARRQEAAASGARSHPGGGEPQAKRQRNDTGGEEVPVERELADIDGFLSSLQYS